MPDTAEKTTWKRTSLFLKQEVQLKPRGWMTHNLKFLFSLCTISTHTHFILSLLNVPLNELQTCLFHPSWQSGAQAANLYLLCRDIDNLSASAWLSSSCYSLQTLDRSLPDHLPSLYDSPSEDFYTGNENKLPLFSDIRLLPFNVWIRLLSPPVKSYYNSHTKLKHKEKETRHKCEIKANWLQSLSLKTF